MFVIFHKVFEAVSGIFSHHVLLRIETEGQDLGQCSGFKSVRVHHVNQKIVIAEFPHDLTADTAGREAACDHTILAAADGDGHKIPVAVIDRLEKAVRSAQLVGP